MTSIFNLKTSTAQLSSANQGTSRMIYVQRPPSRDITGNNFSNGSIFIRWEVSGTRWWIPARTYLRTRATLTDNLGNQLILEDDIAMNMGLMGNLFQSAEFKINGTVVSRISDYMAQVDALEKRLTKSQSWLDSVGKSSNYWQPKMVERQQIITSDGLQVDQVNYRRGYLGNGGVVGIATLGSNLDFLDLLTPNQVQFIVANSEIVFSANGGVAIPDLTRYFSIGESIAFNDGGEKVQQITAFATTVTTNDTLRMSGAILVVAAANLISQVRKARTLLDLDVQQSRRIDGMELVWQPPLSIFKINHAMPAGKYELRLNPQTSSIFQQRVIESLIASKIPGAANDYIFSIVDMYLYTAELDGPRFDDGSYLIDLEETRCQTQNVLNSTGLQQEQYNVSPSTFALTLAFQDSRAGSGDTRYSSSKLKVNAEASDELKLIRMYINYSGENRPQPDSDPSYKIGAAEDYTVQRYTDSIINSGSYYDAGGSESLKQWQDRGAYYYFIWPRDGTDRSTRVNTNFQFSTGLTNASVLLFDHFKKVARIRVENGRVIEVQVEEV